LTNTSQSNILAGMNSAATRQLPPSYTENAHIDISKDMRLLIWLNVFGLALFFLFGWLFLRLAALLRPAYQGSSGSINLWLVINVLLAIVLTFILHELVHGLFFWIFTRSRPTFGFKGAYAYASAPGWYFRRDPYLVIGLAPLVLISLAGLLILPVIPAFLVTPLLFLLTMNASGAVGDMAVVLWLLRFPPDTLVMDHGDAITVFTNTPD
jgi:hypothetical protein